MAINEKTPSGMAVPKGETLDILSNGVLKSSLVDYNTPKALEATILMEVA